jgi:hypothetical protein
VNVESELARGLEAFDRTRESHAIRFRGERE